MKIYYNKSILQKSLICAALLVLILLNIYMVNTLRNERYKNKFILKKINEFVVYSQAIEKQLLTSLEYNNTWLDENIFVCDSSFREYQLSDLISSKKLFLVLPDRTCDVCNDEVFDEIVLIAKKIGLENFIVLVSGNRLKEFLIFFKKYNLNIDCYGLSNGSFSFDDVDGGLIPYSFISNKDLYVTNFFFLASKNHDIREKYFNSVIKEFGEY